MTQEETAIIKKINIGTFEPFNNICALVEFRTISGRFSNYLNLDTVKTMLLDTKKENVIDLVGLPCQVNAGWGEKCSFIKMWK